MTQDENLDRLSDKMLDPKIPPDFRFYAFCVGIAAIALWVIWQVVIWL